MSIYNFDKESTVSLVDTDKLIIGDVSANAIGVATVAALRQQLSAAVLVGDENTTILAANSGQPHLVANVSADRTFTLPTAAAGLDFEFIAQAVGADGHDWIIDAGSDTNFFNGGLLHNDVADDTVDAVDPDGNSNSVVQINVPNGGTRVRVTCDGTNWTISGLVVSAAAPAFSDQ